MELGSSTLDREYGFNAERGTHRLYFSHITPCTHPDSRWGDVRRSEAADAVSIHLGEGRVRPGLRLLRDFRVL
eukprot:2989593-Prymnesium_polylepis.1